MTLDLTRTGDALEGEIVFRSRQSEYPYTYTAVKGTATGQDITLELLADPDPWQFALSGFDSMGTLTGTFSASPWSLSATFTLTELVRGTLVAESSLPQDDSPRGIAVHKGELWLAQLPGYFERRTLDDESLDYVFVYLYPGILWTSKPLTSDGTSLYGHLPVTVQGGNGLSNESDIIRFTEDGVVAGRFRLPHRCTGLTWDGTSLWAVPITSEAMLRFDASGTVLETVPISIPDAQDILFDGQYFWAPSWFLSLLYQMDRQGNILAVFDLPQPSDLSRSVALAHDGTRFWYLVTDLGGGTWLETFHVANP
jgi:hypothetical protein